MSRKDIYEELLRYDKKHRLDKLWDNLLLFLKLILFVVGVLILAFVYRNLLFFLPSSWGEYDSGDWVQIKDIVAVPFSVTTIIVVSLFIEKNKESKRR